MAGAATAMLTINPTATGNAGSYDVVVTDGFGQTQASTAASLTVNSTPAPVAGNNGPVCVGQTLQLSASTISGASYSWSGPNSFTSGQQNPSIASATLAASGTYSVSATVAGCVSPVAMTSAVVNTVLPADALPFWYCDGTEAVVVVTFGNVPWTLDGAGVTTFSPGLLVEHPAASTSTIASGTRRRTSAESIQRVAARLR